MKFLGMIYECVYGMFMISGDRRFARTDSKRAARTDPSVDQYADPPQSDPPYKKEVGKPNSDFSRKHRLRRASEYRLRCYNQCFSHSRPLTTSTCRDLTAHHHITGKSLLLFLFLFPSSSSSAASSSSLFLPPSSTIPSSSPFFSYSPKHRYLPVYRVSIHWYIPT